MISLGQVSLSYAKVIALELALQALIGFCHSLEPLLTPRVEGRFGPCQPRFEPDAL